MINPQIIILGFGVADPAPRWVKYHIIERRCFVILIMQINNQHAVKPDLCDAIGGTRGGGRFIIDLDLMPHAQRNIRARPAVPPETTSGLLVEKAELHRGPWRPVGLQVKRAAVAVKKEVFI